MNLMRAQQKGAFDGIIYEEQESGFQKTVDDFTRNLKYRLLFYIELT